MSSRKVPDAHQELVDDLAAGKTEGPPKKLRPFLRRTRMMCIEPGRERSVCSTQRLNAYCVLDRRLDLEPVADDARIAEQPIDIGGLEGSDAIDVEFSECCAEGRTLPEYRQP